MRKIFIFILILIGIYIYNLDNNIELYDAQREHNTPEEINIDSNIKNINNFRYIKIGTSEEEVISLIGSPSRIDESEYSFKWYVYNQYKESFVMVGIEENKVVALYSNSINSNQIQDISIDKNDRNYIRKNYTPIEYKQKGNTRYIIQSNDEYDIIIKDNNYITFFYDIHNENLICSYQIINTDAELSLKNTHPEEDEEIIKSFEMQVIDLVNSVRYKNNLNPLEYSEKATISSKKHSYDMKNKNYFEHTNKENETPFDRMKKEGIVYISAGENIAAGQVSAIYAHEAWMNSKGHRKNILGNYNKIGVGVCFGGYYNIYYTQNFYK